MRGTECARKSTTWGTEIPQINLARKLLLANWQSLRPVFRPPCFHHHSCMECQNCDKNQKSRIHSYACKIVECPFLKIECRAKRFECRLNRIDGHSKVERIAYEMDGRLEIACRFGVECPSVNKCRFEIECLFEICGRFEIECRSENECFLKI